ncbi:MAG TPA: long-chain fatty acid--CoA ligase [Thermoanaerobaculia bacterium]|nr:long-chain fatty acid--CoA ligase [Thermoanaerobaculia bacterium]
MPSRTIPELLLARVGATPDAPAFLHPDGKAWKTLTWRDASLRAREIACGLLASGLRPGQCVAIASSTRVEWALADLAIGCAGGATATIYPSSSDEDTEFILRDSGAPIVFVENAALAKKVLSRRSALPDLRHVVVFDAPETPVEGASSIAALGALGRTWDAAHAGGFDAALRAVKAEDLAAVIYTSGTTGRPKGVELPHDCWVFEAEAVETTQTIGFRDVQFLWLPLAHVFGKMCLTLGVQMGFPTAIDGRLDRIGDNMAAVEPTFVCAVPRVFQQARAKVIRKALAEGGAKAAIFKWALDVGLDVARRRQAGRAVGLLLDAKHRVADRLVFSKVRARFGKRLKFFFSGSVALPRGLTDFFAASGIAIAEGYGLTESTAMTFFNRPWANRFGTVGTVVPGMDVRIAEDGEVLLRGRGVMRGYRNLPEETAAVIDADGWLHTGDIGTLDADGYLSITDRKKDLVKTSSGKYVAPQRVEGRLTTETPLIAQAVFHGEGRNYGTALLALSEEEVRAWAAKNDLEDRAHEDLVKDERLLVLVRRHVDKVNEGLAPHEAVRKFAVLPRELSVADGELTPSMKVRRKVVEERYRDVLDGLYVDR